MTDVKLDDQSSASSTNDSIVRYGINDEPPLSEAIPLGIQHLLAMFLSTVALPLVIAGAIGLGQSETTFIVQMALLVAGVATIVQVYIRSGRSAPVSLSSWERAPSSSRPLIDIGNSFGIAAIFGAVIVAAPVEIVIGYFYDDLRSLFPSARDGRGRHARRTDARSDGDPVLRRWAGR